MEAGIAGMGHAASMLLHLVGCCVTFHWGLDHNRFSYLPCQCCLVFKYLLEIVPHHKHLHARILSHLCTFPSSFTTRSWGTKLERVIIMIIIKLRRHFEINLHHMKYEYLSKGDVLVPPFLSDSVKDTSLNLGVINLTSLFCNVLFLDLHFPCWSLHTLPRAACSIWISNPSGIHFFPTCENGMSSSFSVGFISGPASVYQAVPSFLIALQARVGHSSSLHSQVFLDALPCSLGFLGSSYAKTTLLPF